MQLGVLDYRRRMLYKRISHRAFAEIVVCSYQCNSMSILNTAQAVSPTPCAAALQHTNDQPTPLGKLDVGDISQSK